MTEQTTDEQRTEVQDTYEELQYWYVLRNTETGEVVGRCPLHFTIDEVMILNWDYKHAKESLEWTEELESDSETESYEQEEA